MPTIPQQIDRILDRRLGRNGYAGHGHLDLVKSKASHLAQVKALLINYQSTRENILQNIANKQGEYYAMSIEDPMFEDSIKEASAEDVIENIDKALAELQLLENRFSRPTINISVIGRARQGKSRLLQSISGLRDEVIPASNGGDCTGAKSVICNRPKQMVAAATVHFYSEVELVEHIQRYLDELHMPVHLGSVSSIPTLTVYLDDFIAQQSTKTGREQSLFNHMRKYVEHFAEYAGLLGGKQDVDENHIRDYVAQYDSNMQPTYKFLAVKEVDIFTEFNYADAGKIVLVDTIGLGDTSLGIREKMLSTLRNDSDAAILVRLPSANGDNIRVEDDELYDTVAEAMGLDMLGKWLFFALNVGEELKNANSGEAMEKALRNRQLNFASITKVDCANNEEVQNRLLIPILQYLIDNLSDVDANLMENANKALLKAYNSYFNLCTKAGNVLRGGLRAALSTGGLFDELFEDKLGLSRELDKLNRRYNTPDEQNEEIRTEVLRIVREIGTHCPKLEDIKHRLTGGGPESHVDTSYNFYADNLRAAMRDQLDEVNSTVIVRLQDEVKDNIINVLRSDEGGRMDRIILNIGDNAGNMEWLRALIDQKCGAFPLLKAALEDIESFRLNIEGLLEYKADIALEHLDQNSPKFTHLPEAVYRADNDEKAEILLQTLMSAIPEVAHDLVGGIQELLKIPANAFNARIRKLRERLIFKQDGRRELKNFYREYAAAIWSEDFRNVVGKQVALDSWNEQLDKLTKENKKDMFTLHIH